MKYAIRINANMLTASVHSLECKEGKKGSRVEVEAVSAQEAAKQFDIDEQFEERGIKQTVVCACCA